ncbi:hypothetical protein BC831DRAFT_451872 [Entophlyctis helioformis]|nr:hypothetical protein BC831DRAFT_451872 [Entophlyctis helioformis]
MCMRDILGRFATTGLTTCLTTLTERSTTQATTPSPRPWPPACPSSCSRSCSATRRYRCPTCCAATPSAATGTAPSRSRASGSPCAAATPSTCCPRLRCSCASPFRDDPTDDPAAARDAKRPRTAATTTTTPTAQPTPTATPTTTPTLAPPASHRDRLKEHVVAFRPFLQEFPRIKALASRLRATLVANNAASILGSLDPPARCPSVYADLFKAHGHIRSVRELILFYCLFSARQRGRAPGLFGSYAAYTQVCVRRLRDPFLVQDRTGAMLLGFLDGGPAGRVLNRGISLTPSVPLYGHLVNTSPKDRRSNYDLGEFSDILQEYVAQLESQTMYTVHPVRGISMFSNRGPAVFTGPLTNGVQVQVSTLPHGDLLGDADLCMAYQIRITFEPDASLLSGCQLLSRKWTISFKSGLKEYAAGPGVIGAFPVFSATQREFTYVSLCPEQDNEELDHMQGEYVFSALGPHGEQLPPFTVPIPAFTLALPPPNVALYEHMAQSYSPSEMSFSVWEWPAPAP